MINRGLTIKVEQPTHLTTPLKVTYIRSTVSQLHMTPHSRAMGPESLDYLETRVVKYRVIEPNSHGVKELRSATKVEPRSQKQMKGPRTLDRAYITQEKARIVAAEARDAEKATHCEAVKLAKELKAQQAIEAAEEPRTAEKGGHSTRAHGGARIARSRLARRLKFDIDDADLQRLERAMSFLAISGEYSDSYSLIEGILIKNNQNEG